MDSWQALKSECAECRGCSLCKTRHSLVFGVGNEQAEVMLIGEGPGEQEDLKGEPFVGPAGKLLDDMLKMIDLERSRVYIANIVKCRPPGNRDPQNIEQDACRGWLDRQIALVNPKIIVCLGRISAKALIDPDFRGSTVSGTSSTAAASWRPTIPPPCCATSASGPRRLWIFAA